jgi:hypothetical protein
MSLRSRRSTLFRTKKIPNRIERPKRNGAGGESRSEKQKSPTDPRGSFGLPSQSQTSIIDGSANVAREFFSIDV